MRLLTVHNRYLVRGGEDECCDAESELLRSRGHDIDEFILDNREIARMSRLVLSARTSWNSNTYSQLRRRIQIFRPDIVNVHNFFPLASPAVYYAARAERVPVVQTLHNYRLLCPGATFFRSGKPCDCCMRRLVPWPGVVHRCYRGSRAASAAVAAMISLHKIFRTWSRMIEVYVALNEFCRNKFIEGGLPADRIVVKPNFVATDLGLGRGDGGYALYVGRLSPEKGINTLIRAWSRIGAKCPLKIVGEGPLSDLACHAAKSNQALLVLGKRPLREVYELMGAATFLVFPSDCDEQFPRTIIEAFSRGTPVIASRRGAVAQIVKHGSTGLLFTAGDAVDLANRVQELCDDPARLQLMRHSARLEFEAKYTAERNYGLIMEIYKRAIAARTVGEK